MNPKDIQTAHDVVRWLRNYVEWSNEASRDMMLRATDVLTRDGYPEAGRLRVALEDIVQQHGMLCQSECHASRRMVEIASGALAMCSKKAE